MNFNLAAEPYSNDFLGQRTTDIMNVFQVAER